MLVKLHLGGQGCILLGIVALTELIYMINCAPTLGKIQYESDEEILTPLNFDDLHKKTITSSFSRYHKEIIQFINF